MLLYDAYQAQADLLAPARVIADFWRAAFADTNFGPAANSLFKSFAAGAELFSRAELSHRRPDYRITEARVETGQIPVVEEVPLEAPFGNLLHFRRSANLNQPRVLIVAPMAGHFATLLRHTIRVMLRDHDVYVTDWKNARDVALTHGKFGTDEYIDHLMTFLGHIGPGAHTVAVCQPCAALTAAVAVMAEKNHRATPRSMTLMAG